MNLHEIVTNVVSVLDEQSPKIKIVAGVIGLIGAGVYACTKVSKFKESVEPEKYDFEKIKKVRASAKHPELVPEEERIPEDITKLYSDRAYAQDVLRTSFRYSLKVVKKFGVPILIAVGSAFLIFNGAHVLSDRLAGTTSALTAVTSAYANYRNNVIERFGKEVDDELYFGAKKKKITEEVEYIDENGVVSTKKEKKEVFVTDRDPLLPSPYAFWFDESCTEYVSDPTQRDYFARCIERNLNDDMTKGARPWITLSEIYDRFGRRKSEYTRDSLVVGNVYDPSDPNRDNKIDLRIQRIYVEDGNGGYIIKTLIDPNVEGSIYGDLPKALRYA